MCDKYGHEGKTDGIKKVQTYQNFITSEIYSLSRRTIGIEPGNKHQRKTRTKITRGNSIIEKWTITKKTVATRRKRRKHNTQTMSHKRQSKTKYSC